MTAIAAPQPTSKPKPKPKPANSHSSSSPSSSSSSPYPFATAPDIIRSHQKDAYFTGQLANTLTDLHRRLLGARSAHSLAPELRAVASLLYFSLTTLPGNRTLGEEYCDLVQVETRHHPGGGGRRLPSLPRRAAYVLGSILLPYLAARALPSLRARIRKVLDKRLATLRAAEKTQSREFRLWNYMSTNLSILTSSAPWHAVTLAVFYFSGTHYELTKRVLSLRYVFSREVPDTPDRAGYELLGVLLAVQIAVQGYLHVRDTLWDGAHHHHHPATMHHRESPGFHGSSVDVSLSHGNSYSENNTLLVMSSGHVGSAPDGKLDISATTHTPAAAVPRYDLTDNELMGYIKGDQQRKCTLCLEELKDPAATQCGHVFCWECIGDWVKEKPECPLCRRDAMVQHILPLRVI